MFIHIFKQLYFSQHSFEPTVSFLMRVFAHLSQQGASQKAAAERYANTFSCKIQTNKNTRKRKDSHRWKGKKNEERDKKASSTAHRPLPTPPEPLRKQEMHSLVALLGIEINLCGTISTANNDLVQFWMP